MGIGGIRVCIGCERLGRRLSVYIRLMHVCMHVTIQRVWLRTGHRRIQPVRIQCVPLQPVPIQRVPIQCVRIQCVRIQCVGAHRIRVIRTRVRTTTQGHLIRRISGVLRTHVPSLPTCVCFHTNTRVATSTRVGTSTCVATSTRVGTVRGRSTVVQDIDKFVKLRLQLGQQRCHSSRVCVASRCVSLPRLFGPRTRQAGYSAKLPRTRLCPRTELCPRTGLRPRTCLCPRIELCLPFACSLGPIGGLFAGR